METDLLQPSIGRVEPTRPLYSSTALFVPAFFGGPVAAAIIFGMNASRAGRLPRDAACLVAGALLLVIVPWTALAFWPEVATQMRLVIRAAGLLAAAVFYWRHRQLHRAQALFGVSSPSGWIPGIGAIVLGMGANILITWWLLVDA